MRKSRPGARVPKDPGAFAGVVRLPADVEPEHFRLTPGPRPIFDLTASRRISSPAVAVLVQLA